MGLGIISKQQLMQALDYQKKVSIKLGEILTQMGLITVEDLNRALNRMKRKLGEILIEMRLIEDYELRNALVQQYE